MIMGSKIHGILKAQLTPTVRNKRENRRIYMNLRQRNTTKAGVGIGIAGTLLAASLLFNAMPASAVDFAHPAFRRVWDRTDSIVASGQVSRTFFWGPAPAAAAQEQYVDAPSGTQTRLVQYFDKSRMELNNPEGDPTSPFFVTNGLLTIELISGQMQIGNNAFVNRFSANIPISGDIDDDQAPTYVSFLAVSNTRRGDHRQPARISQFATATINKAGQVGDDPTKASFPLAKISYFEPTTGHNIPSAFWDFVNATGPISETGQIVSKRLIDPWFYASGLPISDAYWTRVKIKGEMQNVMIQAFERRVLTYVPTNPEGFRVEMGNIGQHYYDWRYKDLGKPTGTPPTSTPGTPGPTNTPGGATSTAVATNTANTTVTSTAGTPGTATATRTGTPATSTPTASNTPNVVTQGYVIFTSTRNAGKKQIWRIRGNGTNETPLTASSLSSDNDFASYSPDFTKIVFTSNRDGNDEIYVMNADGSLPQRLTNNTERDYQPSWSPDGTKIVFVSERGSQFADIYVMNSNGTGQVNITQAVGPDTDPSWGASNRIAFTSKRSGTLQVYTVNPDGTALSPAITSAGENFLPKWNHHGNRIAFVSTRDGGSQEIYTMRAGGEEQTRLTNNVFPDWDPAYAPDDSRIVFSSERSTANLELYTMNINGDNQEKITINEAADIHPDWGLQP
jgi:Tol biopolymer transport system component